MHFSSLNLLFRNMYAKEHPPRVCVVSQEGGLSLTGQQIHLEWDEWKSCTNKRSNRPLAYCPEGKGLVTPFLEEERDTHDPCTATISDENAYLKEVCLRQNFASQAEAVMYPSVWSSPHWESEVPSEAVLQGWHLIFLGVLISFQT